MPLQKVPSFTYINYSRQHLIGERDATQSYINQYTPYVVMYDALDNEVVLHAIEQINAALPEEYTGVNTNRVCLSAIRQILGVSDYEITIYRRNLNRYRDQLATVNERLAQLGDQDEREVNAIEVRKILKDLSYIRRGSVNLLEDQNNNGYLRFTMVDTLITTDEVWSESIDGGLLPNGWSNVVPLEDRPSFLLPSLSFTVNLQNGILSIRSARSNNTLNFGGYKHPHYRDGPCLGGFANPLREYANDLDFISIAAVVRLWAQKAVLADGWGRSFLQGFTHIAMHITGNSYNRVVTSDRGLLFNNNPIKFTEKEPGVWLVNYKDQEYVYNPYEL
jgi:hypothetical protein